jgi:hypothetical protein
VSENYIPGVYNYCDRWCERCPLTARCQVFAVEERRKRGEDDYSAFWKVFDSQTAQNLEDWTEDGGDSFSLPEFESWNATDEFEPRQARDPLVAQAMDYGRQASTWLSQWESDRVAAANGPQPEPVGPIGRDEALDILQWYVHQIGIKLDRAMRGARDLNEEFFDEDTEDDDRFQDEISRVLAEGKNQDRDGSAKVALIGIERSLGAWTILRDHCADPDGQILSFQRTLARLRRLLDKQLPGARTFQRPGFDNEV